MHTTAHRTCTLALCRSASSNWVQTVPGKGWFTLSRLHSPLEPWFDKTWRPVDIEEPK